MIRDRLLQDITFLNSDLSGSEHLLFRQKSSQWHLLSPWNIMICRRMYPIPIITLYHAIERKWFIWNWARITTAPVGRDRKYITWSSTHAGIPTDTTSFSSTNLTKIHIPKFVFSLNKKGRFKVTHCTGLVPRPHPRGEGLLTFDQSLGFH